jgi:uncharacterized membrane protein
MLAPLIAINFDEAKSAPLSSSGLCRDNYPDFGTWTSSAHQVSGGRTCLTGDMAKRSGAHLWVTRWRSASSRDRLLVVLALGIVAGLLTGFLGSWKYSALVGWDAMAALFSLATWLSVRSMNAADTAAHASLEDPSQPVSDILLIAASVASLVAVAVVLATANSAHGSRRWLLAGLAAASVALSWLLIHTLFTLAYARLYHRGDTGISFNQHDPPRYTDFAYLAFTIGMTFQVSDTSIGSSPIRAAALRHALLSYLFGAVILATTVNFVVSLSSSS